MATRRNSLNFPLKTFGIITVLAIGATMGLYTISQSTDYRQRASEELNINAAGDNTTTTNPDGTMGPATAAGNYANTLSVADLGTLSVQISNPTQTTPSPRKEKAGKILPTQAQGKERKTNSSPFTSLIVKVKKAEVHLAQLENPGKLRPTQAPDALYPSPTNRRPYDRLTGADKWETLVIDESLSYVDLIDLARKNNSQTLGLTQLANGKYTQIRLYIESAVGTLEDGREVTLTIPPYANVIKIVRPFTIKAGQVTTVMIDFNAEKSVIKVGDTYVLQPFVTRFLTNK